MNQWKSRIFGDEIAALIAAMASLSRPFGELGIFGTAGDAMPTKKPLILCNIVHIRMKRRYVSFDLIMAVAHIEHYKETRNLKI